MKEIGPQPEIQWKRNWRKEMDEGLIRFPGLALNAIQNSNSVVAY
jgi:hypothetical protein